MNNNGCRSKRKLFADALAVLGACMLCLTASAARANGRLPAATGLAIHPSDTQQMLLGLTYGLALSRDGGANWTWMCEGQIEGNGTEINPAVVMTSDGTLVVLSLTNRGLLISRDDGCTFEKPIGPLQGKRGVDLTLDPSQPGRVLALMSTIMPGSSEADPRYNNLVAHSLDHGQNWEILSELPETLIPETLEVASSDPNRIYVTGVAGSNQLQGTVERSDDGGHTWKQTSVELPRGSGSMYLSAIHPTDPNRLWIRAPRRGDIYGLLPTKLWMSADGGASFDQVAATEGGMLGFALSPDGDRIAFGGPLDGLMVAPSNASEAPAKLSDMPVSCLRWRETGLYTCALEPTAPFGLGLAAEPMQDFVPLWHRANSCRATCAPPSRLESLCREPWNQLAPLLDASMPLCDDSSTLLDAGVSDQPVLDAGAPFVDASTMTTMTTKPTKAGGCNATVPGGGRTSGSLMLVLMLLGWRRKRGARRLAMLLSALSCSCAAQTEDQDAHAESADDDDFKGCPELTANFEPGAKAGGDHFELKLVSAMPSEPERYLNSWTIEVASLDGSLATDAVIERSQTFMPVHGHDGRVVPEITQAEEPGHFHVERINFSMRGPWEARFWLRSPTLGDDYVVFHVCVAK